METLSWASSGGDSASEVLFLIFDHDQSRTGDWKCKSKPKLLKIKYILKWTTYFKEYNKVSLPYLVKGFDVNKSL